MRRKPQEAPGVVRLREFYARYDGRRGVNVVASVTAPPQTQTSKPRKQTPAPERQDDFNWLLH